MIAALKSGFVTREPRRVVLVQSRMQCDAGWVDICIHNVSSRGLMAATDAPPAVGSYVDIRRGTQAIVGRVMWRKDRLFGLRARDRIDMDALVREPRLNERPRNRQADAAEDRRVRSRQVADAMVARRLEQSRAISSAIQFGLMALGGLSVAGYAALSVHELLSEPLEAVGSTLGAAE